MNRILALLAFIAFAGFVAKVATNSWPLGTSLFIGVVAAVAIGGVMGLLHGTLSIRYRMDQIISGTVIIMLAAGLSAYLYDRDAIAEGILSTDRAQIVSPDTPVEEAAHLIKRAPLLVVDGDSGSRLMGILTAFDIM